MPLAQELGLLSAPAVRLEDQAPPAHIMALLQRLSTGRPPCLQLEQGIFGAPMWQLPMQQSTRVHALPPPTSLAITAISMQLYIRV